MKSTNFKIAGYLIAGVFAIGVGLGYGIVLAPAGPADTQPLAQAGGAAIQFEQFFPDAEFEELEENVYLATRDGENVGLVGQGTGAGYNEGIVALVAVDMEGSIVGIDVLDHNETEGLGDVITEEDFLVQFEGLTQDNVALAAHGGEIDGISGATESSEGLVSIVDEVIDRLSEHM